jgi:hypothetical protein
MAALLTAALLSGARAIAAEPPAAPPVPQNLLTNPDFEIDADRDGVPDGWHHSEPEFWPGPAKDSPLWKRLQQMWVEKGSVPPHIPFRPPTVLEGGTYHWEADGWRSSHAIAIDETADRKWGEWNTVVRGIKPNTDYVILGVRRQTCPADPGDAPPWLHVGVFGRMIPVRGTAHRDAWIPFVLAVNSGSFKGDCRLGFILQQAHCKLWLDGLAMFEGEPGDLPRFLCGNKGARLDYPVHDTAYASPDAECPFFFDLMWSFQNGNGDRALEIVVDVPRGLELGAGPCGMGLRLEPAEPQPITVEGRPYTRLTFAVHAEKADKLFDSAGRRPVRLWLKTERVVGRFEMFYRCRWRGGEQAVQPLGVDVIRIPRARPHRHLLTGIGDVPAELAASRAETLAKELPAMGVGAVALNSGLDAKSGAVLDKAGLAQAGWFTLGGPAVPENLTAADPAGKPIPGTVCPVGLSDATIRQVFPSAVELAMGGSSILMTDLRQARHAPCFRPRTVAAFREHLKQNHADVAFVEPKTFTAAPDKHAPLVAAWRTFHLRQYASLYRALRQELAKARADAKPPVRNGKAPLQLVAVVPAPGGGTEAERKDRADAYKALADVFDVLLVEPAEGIRAGRCTPAETGETVERLVKPLPPGGKAGVILSAGSSEDRSAPAPVIRHADIFEQTLEALAGGAKAVLLRPFNAVDGKDLQQYAAALALVEPFWPHIRAGRPAATLAVDQKPGRVVALEHRGRVLALVSDYAARPAAEVVVALKFPKGAKRVPLALYDVATRRLVAKVPADAASVAVPLAGRRSALFYLAPAKARPPFMPAE